MAAELDDREDQPALFYRFVDALAFLVRKHLVFWLVALPIAGLAGAVAYILDANLQLVEYRDHWGWYFLFALIYAMFLDRWFKETLLDGASDCDAVDNLRRSVTAVRFLAVATVMFALAMALSLLRIEGIAPALEAWNVPHAMAVVLGMTLSWLPHVLIWTMALTYFAPMLPALSAAESVGRHAVPRVQIFKLILGLAVASLLAHSTTLLGVGTLPSKPWAAAAMAAAWRFFDCLLLALGGYVLATIWREAADWEPPEPDDQPYRSLYRAWDKRARRA